MSIKSELLAIKGKRKLLKPKAVVDWAKSHPESKLHGCFTWDVDKASYEYWLWQARQLITVHVRTEDKKPLMVSLSVDRVSPGGGFRVIDEVLQEADLVAVMLADALKELTRVRDKYDYLKALKPVWDGLDEVVRSQETSSREARNGGRREARAS